MTARERITKAFAFEKTDRIPRYEIFLPEFTRAWRQAKGRPDGDPAAEYHIDIPTVLADQGGPLLSGACSLGEQGGYDLERDGWGRVLKKRRDAYFEEEVSAVLADKGGLDRLAFDDPAAPSRLEPLARAARAMQPRFAPVCGVLGLYMGSFRMRGQEQYLMDLAEDPAFCAALAERLGDFLAVQGIALAEATGTADTAVWVYDEFASQRGPMFSRSAYEAVFLPVYRRVFRAWRERGIRNIVLHCDGNCGMLLDAVLDTGFNGYQGPAPSAGMWLPDLKARYGKRLALIGGMCNTHTLVHGSKAEIEREAGALAEAAGDGGVILGTHSVDRDVAVERYEAYDGVVRGTGWG